MKINIGSGYRKYPNFINLDKDTNTHPDYVIDFEKDLLPFDDNTIDEVKAHYIFEYLGDKFFFLMKEIYRVCKPEAILDIATIHHRSELWYDDINHVRFITVENMKMFSKKFNNLNIASFKSNVNIANTLDIDFEIIDFEYKLFSDWEERFKSLTPEQIIDITKNFNNVYKETYIKMMVIK